VKKIIIYLILSVTASVAFGQAKLPTAAVATFDTVGSVSPDEAAVVTELFMSQIVQGGKINVVDRNNFDKIIQQMRFQASDWSDSNKIAQLGRALNAEYIIRGQIMKMGNTIYISSSMIDVNTTVTIASTREQLSSFDELFSKLPNITEQILDKLPEQNWLVGRWQTSDGNCVLEFKADRTIVVERYVFSWDFGSSDEGKGVARGTGFYSTNFPASGGGITINLSLTGASGLDKFGSDVSIYLGDSDWNGYFRWKDNSKNSFKIQRVKYDRWGGDKYSDWAGLLKNKSKLNYELYSEFFRIK